MSVIERVDSVLDGVQVKHCSRGENCINETEGAPDLPLSEFTNPDAAYCKPCRDAYDDERRKLAPYLTEREWPKEWPIGARTWYRENTLRSIFGDALMDELIRYGIPNTDLNGRTYYLARTVRSAVRRMDKQAALTAWRQAQDALAEQERFEIFARREEIAEFENDNYEISAPYSDPRVEARYQAIFGNGNDLVPGNPGYGHISASDLNGNGNGHHEIVVSDEWLPPIETQSDRVIDYVANVLNFLLSGDQSKSGRLMYKTITMLKEFGFTDDDIDGMLATE